MDGCAFSHSIASETYLDMSLPNSSVSDLRQRENRDQSNLGLQLHRTSCSTLVIRAISCAAYLHVCMCHNILVMSDKNQMVTNVGSLSDSTGFRHGGGVPCYRYAYFSFVDRDASYHTGREGLLCNQPLNITHQSNMTMSRLRMDMSRVRYAERHAIQLTSPLVERPRFCDEIEECHQAYRSLHSPSDTPRASF